MRSRPFITLDHWLLIGSLFVLLTTQASGQRLAVITPDRTQTNATYVAGISEHLPSPIRLVDHGLADIAFRSVAIQDPFNMTVDEARSAATVIGCDYFVVVRSGEQRRSSFSVPEYYEAYTFLYLVDGRTGTLISWQRTAFEGANQQQANKALASSIENSARRLSREVSDHHAAAERISGHDTPVEEVPAEGSAAAIGLKPPIPFRRAKPEYTQLAFLYNVRATIDADVVIAADGTVTTVRFVRWAGFGLEESVEKTIRSMNWRPAMRNGKALPMRILLRYNFTKVDKE